jgi:hypothetical protein
MEDDVQYSRFVASEDLSPRHQTSCSGHDNFLVLVKRWFMEIKKEPYTFYVWITWSAL